LSPQDPKAEDAAAGPGWWGTFTLEPGQVCRWDIDRLQLWIRRAEREWQIARVLSEEDAPRHGAAQLDVAMPESPDALERHVFSKTRGPLRLSPVVADRPVVTSPRMPVYLAQGEKTTLYVGSPLWVRVEAETPAQEILDAPIRRLSDTWFGPTTREGEICYAARTQAILDPANLPSLAAVAITPVAIENRGSETLRVERLKLPVPFLSVHAAPDGQLWTPTVTMVSQKERGMASFDVGQAPPHRLSTRRVTAAREQPEDGLLIRAFSLFRTQHNED